MFLRCDRAAACLLSALLGRCRCMVIGWLCHDVNWDRTRRNVAPGFSRADRAGVSVPVGLLIRLSEGQTAPTPPGALCSRRVSWSAEASPRSFYACSPDNAAPSTLRSSSNMGEGIVVCAPPSAAFREAGRSVTTVGKLESAKGCLYQAGVLPSMGTFEQGSCPPWEGFPGPDFHQESHGRFRAQAIALGMAGA